MAQKTAPLQRSALAKRLNPDNQLSVITRQPIMILMRNGVSGMKPACLTVEPHRRTQSASRSSS
ncbi:hypothetical protein CFter6_3536 [Collimonas fungivorans]|uniref:Uncharacterized protein n=1 Tax=Collimonas fungivorans TaxID=158899 RepID=A0A127PEG0_9BURK|nr:hypothetical protein CFter6_3536 [Collimonas fungivorans]